MFFGHVEGTFAWDLAWKDPTQEARHLARSPEPAQAVKKLLEEWLRGQRRELMASGLYGSRDAVLMAIDMKIAQAFSCLYMPIKRL